MADQTKTVDVKRQQRRILLVGLVVAAIPFVCQLLMLIALAAAPAGTFPAADRSFTDLRFWPIQIVLLCVSVSATRSWIVSASFGPPAGRTELRSDTCFGCPFSSSSSRSCFPSRFWLAIMTVIGSANLNLAYMLEMELAKRVESAVVRPHSERN